TSPPSVRASTCEFWVGRTRLTSSIESPATRSAASAPTPSQQSGGFSTTHPTTPQPSAISACAARHRPGRTWSPTTHSAPKQTAWSPTSETSSGAADHRRSRTPDRQPQPPSATPPAKLGALTDAIDDDRSLSTPLTRYYTEEGTLSSV